MVSQSRAGTFSPNPTLQTVHSGISHSPHPSQAGASPSTSSPTGSSSLTKIVVAQVYLLLSTIKDEKDEKWQQLRKLIDDNGMEAYTKYFTRLVSGNASQIFPGLNRPVLNPGNTYPMLVGEMRKLSTEPEQARRIAESIETGNEDIFRDFDLSTFMEHFRLDALEKTILALAFKLGSRPDLKTKADAILSTNFPTFVNILRRLDGDHADMSPDFIAEIIDRFIQLHPPNFNAAAKAELRHNVQARYAQSDQAPPSQVLAALDLMRVLGDRPPNALALYIHRTGPDFTSSDAKCAAYLENRPGNNPLSEEQVSVALMYTTISQTQRHNPSVLVAALRHVLPKTFRWQDVVSYFDVRDVRISSNQFLRLYNALLPVAQDGSSNFDIQRLWGGEWDNPETQLSFICAFASLTPDQLDASTIPGLVPTLTLDSYAHASAAARDRAAYAVRHPLVSAAALSAVFNVALHSIHASQSIEAKRLFQDVVVPNLDIFVVSAFGIPKPWPPMAVDTINTLFDNFLSKQSVQYDFVLESLWSKDKDWVKQRLVDAHVSRPMDLPLILEHAVEHAWLDELVYLPNGFGLDLTALAHAQGFLDLQQWSRRNAELGNDVTGPLLQFLLIKSSLELEYQNPPDGQPPIKAQTALQVRTVSSLLDILQEYMPTPTPSPELTFLQRRCISAYPRLVNYGEGFDDIIDANGRDGNALPPAANAKMEEHYKKMYGDEIQVRTVVDILERYKKSRDPLDQDVFASMIHGLLDEYSHYIDYPLEALATTAVLFGGIISHKLVSNLPLKVGLGMILESVRDHQPHESMYKFGLQALMQLFSRLHEWPGYCKLLTQIPGLLGTEAYKKAEEIVRADEDDRTRSLRNGTGAMGHAPGLGADTLANGKLEDAAGSETQTPPFSSINVDPPPPGIVYEEPGDDAQGKIQFVLNNLTETTLQSMFRELKEMLEQKHQQWFASHLVEERAKMQPNYHQVYLELVKQFEDKALWAEVLRETFISVQRMLNSEITMQNSTERTHLKNLGGWLGLLTLARDKPIRHKNIAFKDLLTEAYDTKRLMVVIPFVCKVLIQGAKSNVFRPPNPWLMDIINLLIELYHNAELKLNLKFEIEVLCKGLSLDHKSIEPTGEILNRVVPVEDAGEIVAQDGLDSFENMSLNGMAPAMSNTLSLHAVVPPIPDLGPSLTLPQTEVVGASRLREIVLAAVTRALQDIIQPVVDRSVTIAAIATAQMIKKDFCTEPDENRMRTSAINMVKSTAGSLALVTSKEPLRANFTNYLRNLANELPNGLPEGVIIMCVNSNLDLASGVIEKHAEERAVPEIEALLEDEFENRRRHRMERGDQPYFDHNLSRWAMTIPNPFKLSHGMGGLNPEQLAIYEDFARQPRAALVSTTPSHVPSTSDATRSLANEVLQDQYSTLPSIPTPAETPSLPHLTTQSAQVQHYPPVQTAMTNGRQPGLMDARVLADRLTKLLHELQRIAADAREEHLKDLPRPHPILDIIDAIVQLVIKTHQTSEEFVMYAAEQIMHLLLNQVDDSLVLETLVHVLETLRRIAGHVISQRIRANFHQQPGHLFLHLPLISALLGTDLLDWRNIDNAMARALQARKDGSIDFLEQLMDLTLLNDSPLALYSDFVRSLEEAWTWIAEEPEVQGGLRFKAKVLASPPELPANLTPEEALSIQQEQMDYVFEEWIHLCNNPNASDKSAAIFVEQMTSRRLITGKHDLHIFIRHAMDKSVDKFDQVFMAAGGLATVEAYQSVDALVKMIMIFLKAHDSDDAGHSSRADFLNSVLALVVLILSHHQAKRGEHFNQKVFFRFFSILLHEIDVISEQFTEVERDEMFLRFASRLLDVGPAYFPGFLYAWVALMSHRVLVPALLRMHDKAGWAAYTKLLKHLLGYFGDQSKSMDGSPFAKDIYRVILKLFGVLSHDFPDYVTANYIQLCQSIPPYCAQLLNLVLVATPESVAKMPDPLDVGLIVEAMTEVHDTPTTLDDPSGYLREAGLLHLLNQALEHGPTEDAIAQITHAINKPDGETTTFGFVPVKANVKLIYAVTTYIGGFAAARAASQGRNSNPFVSGASDIKTLFMLILESGAEARHYILSSMINQLRYANSFTYYFSQALIEIFGHDLEDPEESEIREQIVRIFLERLIGFWAQPWGLVVTVVELLRNERINFFELPWIKSSPQVRDRFAQVLQHRA
ncbi:Not1-domain-containing protein [Coniochaeta sp. PMI_546]|nr:Not1-domain-containing protein [Coniochaeta sp. PMI_546]